jgi:hypothetical protein
MTIGSIRYMFDRLLSLVKRDLRRDGNKRAAPIQVLRAD